MHRPRGRSQGRLPHCALKAAVVYDRLWAYAGLVAYAEATAKGASSILQGERTHLEGVVNVLVACSPGRGKAQLWAGRHLQHRVHIASRMELCASAVRIGCLWMAFRSL